MTASSGGRRLRPAKWNSSFCPRIRWVEDREIDLCRLAFEPAQAIGVPRLFRTPRDVGQARLSRTQRRRFRFGHGLAVIAQRAADNGARN